MAAPRGLGRDTFSRATLRLPAGHFGLGYGSGAHAPNEYYVIESTNPKTKASAEPYAACTLTTCMNSLR